MTGRELIEMIQINCHLDDEFYVMDGDGKIVDIKVVEHFTKRDPYDGDFDRSASAIVLHDNCTIKD